MAKSMFQPFPHAAYAEDQPYSYTILTTHVLHRGLQTGALIGLLAGAGRSFLSRRKQTVVSPAIAPSLLRSAGVGAVWGTGFLAVGLVARMWGREKVEWQDRSWRLLANEGQVECDDWSIGGSVVGGLGVLARDGLRGGAVRVLGGFSLGNLAGVAGYMAWRYGMHGGKRE